MFDQICDCLYPLLFEVDSILMISLYFGLNAKWLKFVDHYPSLCVLSILAF